MRGKDMGASPSYISRRITPAYAGKSSGWRWVITISQDHPRLCGEKLALAGKFTGEVGSPPPMRGKAGEQTPETMYQRITPAYAGKSSRKEP